MKQQSISVVGSKTRRMVASADDTLNRGGRSYQGERVDTQIYCIQEEAMDAHICPSGKGRTIISRRKVGVA